MTKTAQGNLPRNLPDAGARLTKRAKTIMSSWNDDVRLILEGHGAKLSFESLADPNDTLVGYDYRSFELETPAGRMTVTPHGNWLACRFDDPDAAGKLLGNKAASLNEYSGKWNHHYYEFEYQNALDDVRRLFDDLLAKSAAA